MIQVGRNASRDEGFLIFMSERVVILLDGGFVKKKLEELLGHFPTVAEVVTFSKDLMTKSDLASKELFRVFWYDAPPFSGNVRNPINGAQVNLALSPQATQNLSLIDSLEMQEDFAVRRGALSCSGWKLGISALKRIKGTNNKTIAAHDLVPNIQQKGVDMRIGLDMSLIALKRLAQNLVLVTGDSDFVPVMKFVRREGMRVYLAHMGHPTHQILRAHADRLI
jgi:uncharacterized LabA/DUF88 family protein